MILEKSVSFGICGEPVICANVSSCEHRGEKESFLVEESVCTYVCETEIEGRRGKLGEARRRGEEKSEKRWGEQSENYM